MKNTYLNGKDNIILTSIEIMDELGIYGLTIRELAKRLGITEGAIYRHYTSKQEIIMAVLEYYSNFDSRINNSVKSQDLKAKESIVLFIKSYLEYYENYPAITGIIFTYDAMKYDAVLAQKVNEIITERYNCLNELIRRGQEQMEITKELTGEELGNVIMGLELSIILKWRMSNYKFPLKDTVMSALEPLIKMC